ncbi:unnamed protein product, partial [Angiostrongylus costaricensis]|uniref:Rab-GAP TBC domain-containing protein n=1 Tax=Angiostrongylus costaricensis TaxID=334426 RepID=A0A0R3Q2U9_ANGCS
TLCTLSSAVLDRVNPFHNTTTTCTDELLQQARSLFTHNSIMTYFQFANGLNPVVDGSWMLVPVRRVLDAVHKREICEDDVEIVRLALLWTVLLHDERPTVFSFANTNDIYVRLGEVLIIGPNILADDIIASCYSRILTEYILKAAVDGRLCLRMGSRIAGLDAFMPFFEDLLIHFEQYSLGNVGFARTLLIGAYLNAAITDRYVIFSLWSTDVSSQCCYP